MSNTQVMKILVFGAGAMGSFLGGLLSQKNEVTLIGRKQHMEAIRREGLRITGMSNLRVYPLAKERIDGKESPDLVIVTTKCYDTEDAIRALKPFHKRSIFLSLQNGLDNEEILSRFASKVLGGVTSHGITFVRPGNIYHAGEGITVIGNYKGAGDKVSETARVLTESGIETTASDDIRKEIWKKVIVNAGINPITAITGYRNGLIFVRTQLESIVEAVCEEAVRVANAYGIEISAEEAIFQTKEVARLTAENKSSMLQDIENGKRTEIDSICGAISRLGAKKGIPTPVNSTLTALVKGIEKEW